MSPKKPLAQNKAKIKLLIARLKKLQSKCADFKGHVTTAKGLADKIPLIKKLLKKDSGESLQDKSSKDLERISEEIDQLINKIEKELDGKKKQQEWLLLNIQNLSLLEELIKNNEISLRQFRKELEGFSERMSKQYEALLNEHERILAALAEIQKRLAEIDKRIGELDRHIDAKALELSKDVTEEIKHINEGYHISIAPQDFYQDILDCIKEEAESAQSTDQFDHKQHAESLSSKIEQKIFDRLAQDKELLKLTKEQIAQVLKRLHDITQKKIPSITDDLQERHNLGQEKNSLLEKKKLLEEMKELQKKVDELSEKILEEEVLADTTKETAAIPGSTGNAKVEPETEQGKATEPPTLG